MAKATVTLKDSGPLSIDVGGRHFNRGQAHTITDASEIARFKIEPIFDVQVLEDEPKAPPKSRDDDEEEQERDDESELSGDKVGELNEESMRAMNKKQLVEAAAARGIEVDPQQTKGDMIAQIKVALKE